MNIMPLVYSSSVSLSPQILFYCHIFVSGKEMPNRSCLLRFSIFISSWYLLLMSKLCMNESWTQVILWCYTISIQEEILPTEDYALWILRRSQNQEGDSRSVWKFFCRFPTAHPSRPLKMTMSISLLTHWRNSPEEVMEFGCVQSVRLWMN